MFTISHTKWRSDHSFHTSHACCLVITFYILNFCPCTFIHFALEIGGAFHSYLQHENYHSSSSTCLKTAPCCDAYWLLKTIWIQWPLSLFVITAVLLPLHMGPPDICVVLLLFFVKQKPFTVCYGQNRTFFCNYIFLALQYYWQ